MTVKKRCRYCGHTRFAAPVAVREREAGLFRNYRPAMLRAWCNVCDGMNEWPAGTVYIDNIRRRGDEESAAVPQPEEPRP